MKRSPKKKKKETTIDDLAGMVQRGFLNQESKFNKRFDTIEEEISGLKDFEKRTDKAVFELQSDMDEVKKRLGSIEKTLGPLTYTVDNMKFNLRDYELRISRLEKKAGLVNK